MAAGDPDGHSGERRQRDRDGERGDQPARRFVHMRRYGGVVMSLVKLRATTHLSKLCATSHLSKLCTT